MKQNSQGLKNFDVICISLLLTLLAFGLGGCTGNRGFEIFPLNNQNALTLTSDDVVRVMRQAGFSDNQILQYGEDLYNALAQYGAAQIKIRKKLEAVFAINGDAVYISTRLRGNFIYNVKTGWVGGG
ncbi:MAG: hypothetical protein HQ580_03060 [Planctomycetes bacterium]|nr:hypothetical protein [Planctomycetota bacterium]